MPMVRHYIHAHQSFDIGLYYNTEYTLLKPAHDIKTSRQHVTSTTVTSHTKGFPEITIAFMDCTMIHIIAECTIGDIRLRGEERNATATTGGLEVCVSGNWRSVCNTGGWHSDSLNGISNNTRVACRQLGYREEGIGYTINGQLISTTIQFHRSYIH